MSIDATTFLFLEPREDIFQRACGAMSVKAVKPGPGGFLFGAKDYGRTVARVPPAKGFMPLQIHYMQWRELCCNFVQGFFHPWSRPDFKTHAGLVLQRKPRVCSGICG
jgi:hypothetical protein